MENKKNNILAIIILSVIFGMASGVVGEIIARVYLLDSYYNIPFFGEINLPNGNEIRSGLIIRNANKVVVEQDTKITEIINSSENSVVGVFKKIVNNSDSEKFDLKNYYQANNEIGQGIIITTDGWILTSYKPRSLEESVVITKDKKIYNIDKIVNDEITGFNFLHIKANDLQVKKLASDNEIEIGQLALAISWNSQAWLSRVKDKEDTNLVKSSDYFFNRLDLIDNIPNEFIGSALFNLSGDIIGIINNKNEVESISHLQPAIYSLLKNKEISRASLGVNYVNLADLIDVNKKGALIYKDANGIAVAKKSHADLAGLKEGDIIIFIDGVEINEDNDLINIIQSYAVDDIVNVVYLRNGERGEVEVKL